MKIGDVFEYEGKKYRAIKEKTKGSCDMCAFWGKPCRDFKNTIELNFKCGKNDVIFELVENESTVYGKKIVIDGVEYVAVPEKKGGILCEGCAFCINDIATCKASGDNAEIFEAAFGYPSCKNSYRMILKKVAPKKKPASKSVVAVAPESAWGKTALPNVTSEVYGQPYLNPLDMMMGNKTVLVDNKPCKIIDSRHEYDYHSTKHIVTFEEMPCKLTPVIRCDAASYIVCLSESDGIKPSDVPKQHYSEADAIKEAERLCKKHNQKFVVLKVVAEVSPMICPVTTKRG